MSKRNITIGLIVMVVINLALITMIILHANGHDRWKGPSPHMLVRQLDLDETQQVQFEGLKEDHFTVVNPKMKKIRELKKALMNTADRDEALQLTSDIGKLEGEIDYLTFEHFTKVRAMCTPEQQQKMDEIKKQISERVSERNHRNHGSRPHR
ncbi:MAG: periplasmic heavy metal sensor [Cyclobacteriaceae bacterium]